MDFIRGKKKRKEKKREAANTEQNCLSQLKYLFSLLYSVRRDNKTQMSNKTTDRQKQTKFLLINNKLQKGTENSIYFCQKKENHRTFEK